VWVEGGREWFYVIAYPVLLLAFFRRIRLRFEFALLVDAHIQISQADPERLLAALPIPIAIAGLRGPCAVTVTVTGLRAPWP
jgi:hypothetical protein